MPKRLQGRASGTEDPSDRVGSDAAERLSTMNVCFGSPYHSDNSSLTGTTGIDRTIS
jgi:hypothetical protein